MYQSIRRSLAPSRPLPPSGAFREAIHRAAGVALLAPDLTQADRQLFHDYRRDESRYKWDGVDRLVDALARVPEEADALSLVEDLRAVVIARRRRNEQIDLMAAYDAETVAGAEADVVQAHALRDPSPLNKEACRKAVVRQMANARRFLDDLAAFQPARAR